ncbi:MAG: argininosuccinate lyase [Bryobacteraceae bacterium]|jgi:argininosuccinate lyase
MKLWGGRFESGPSEVFERFSESLHFDKRLLDVDIRGSLAQARALERVGILTVDERDRMLAALEQIREESRSPQFFDGAADEDVHTVVIRKLKERVGSLADKIHTGRSRNDQVSLDTRLWLREQIDLTVGLLHAFLRALLKIAREYPDAIIPGYTHTRRAQPVPWAHYILAYFEMFWRDRERFFDARRRVNVMPLGSGALAGSGFPVDRAGIARELGFDEITRNSMDASGDRDFVLDFLYAASTTMLHLSRFAEDWILYSGEEYRWIELGDDVTSGSSIMPQKKNPDSLELIRGKCGRVFGSLSSLFVTMKGTPMTYNRDMQEDKEPLFDAADQVAGSLEMARVVVESAKLDPSVPLAAAEDSWAVATDIADALARNGMPFHQAHQIAGRIVLTSIRAGKKPVEWTADELVAFDSAFKPDMIRFFRPAEGMKTRELPGGSGPNHVTQALADAEARLAAK